MDYLMLVILVLGVGYVFYKTRQHQVRLDRQRRSAARSLFEMGWETARSDMPHPGSTYIWVNKGFKARRAGAKGMDLAFNDAWVAANYYERTTH